MLLNSPLVQLGLERNAGGQGEDADQLDANARARLRQQALDWLRADLAAWR
jgi:hypothetical protein